MLVESLFDVGDGRIPLGVGDDRITVGVVGASAKSDYIFQIWILRNMPIFHALSGIQMIISCV